MLMGSKSSKATLFNIGAFNAMQPHLYSKYKPHAA